MLPHFPWTPDRGDGTFGNPVLFADYSDPDVIRVGTDFWMTASSFQCVPGLPVLHSPDLVNWTIAGHAVSRLPFPRYDRPAHGCGVWAPSLRHHAGKYRIVFGDPDVGILTCTADDPAGSWSPLHTMRPARGWIDPCPFWDDDGQAYLVHAFAGSRAGIKSVLDVCRMAPDGSRLLDDGTRVFAQPEKHPTIEGPKLYKRNGFYYIFAPAGGVKPGWQTVLRSRNVLGPYEDRIVMAQGRTAVNGPHQGGWVELESGEGWFLHFQDRGPYGRVVHLQPLRWVDDWPVIGEDPDGDGVGDPVAAWRKPDVGRSWPVRVPATGDGFDGPTLGLQWQWNANWDPGWYSLEARAGTLRLQAVPAAEPIALAMTPNLLTQKFSAPAFRATAAMELAPQADGECAGLAVVGLDSACLMLARAGDGFRLSLGVERENGVLDGAEGADWPDGRAYLRVEVRDGALCRFLVGGDGKDFRPFGPEFQAREGRWIGTRIGLFCLHPGNAPGQGYADFDWFRMEAPEGPEGG